MHFHSQNLNERRGGGTLGSKFWNGRCWLHFGQSGGHCLGMEWSFLRQRLSIGLDLATHDHALSWNFCIGIVNLYFHLDYWPMHRWLSNKIKRHGQKYGNGREIGISVFDGAVMIDLWNDPMESRCKQDPWWWHIYLVPKDILLGRAEYSERILRTSRVEVPMPEAVYPATVEMQEATWKRPRWPWPLRVQSGRRLPQTSLFRFPAKARTPGTAERMRRIQ